ncbi:MAG: hypothetical protein K8S94_04390 [Planctomycetia bacterium]|nr:hypothetical protein [Planctomycetia bacterium]
MITPAIGSTATEPDDLAQREHARRERAWNPAARWQAILETIRWAEAQAHIPRNTPAACIEQERRRQPGSCQAANSMPFSM